MLDLGEFVSLDADNLTSMSCQFWQCSIILARGCRVQNRTRSVSSNSE